MKEGVRPGGQHGVNPSLPDSFLLTRHPCFPLTSLLLAGLSSDSYHLCFKAAW